MSLILFRTEVPEDPPEPDEFFSVTVDSRSFLKFLASYTIASTTIACICSQHCIILYVYVGEHSSHQGQSIPHFSPNLQRKTDATLAYYQAVFSLSSSRPVIWASEMSCT